jgi:hypothetical protein
MRHRLFSRFLLRTMALTATVAIVPEVVAQGHDWRISRVAPSVPFGAPVERTSSPALAIDPQTEMPGLVYHRDGGTPDWQVAFARFDGTGWQSTDIDSLSSDGGSSNCGFFSDGRPAVAYTRYGPANRPAVYYSEFDGSVWTAPTLVAGSDNPSWPYEAALTTGNAMVLGESSATIAYQGRLWEGPGSGFHYQVGVISGSAGGVWTDSAYARDEWVYRQDSICLGSDRSVTFTEDIPGVQLEGLKRVVPCGGPPYDSYDSLSCCLNPPPNDYECPVAIEWSPPLFLSSSMKVRPGTADWGVGYEAFLGGVSYELRYAQSGAPPTTELLPGI